MKVGDAANNIVPRGTVMRKAGMQKGVTQKIVMAGEGPPPTT
jgi:hypothetical protein